MGVRGSGEAKDEGPAVDKAGVESPDCENLGEPGEVKNMLKSAVPSSHSDEYRGPGCCEEGEDEDGGKADGSSTFGDQG